MAVVDYVGQVESSIAPEKLFRMIFLEPEIYIPKVLGNAVKKFEILQKDGDIVTVKSVTFAEGSLISHVVETIDYIDIKNCECHYSVIGGDPNLIDTSKVEKMSFFLKLEARADGGTLATRSCKGYVVEGAKIDEEEVRAGLIKTFEVFKGIFKAYEAYAIEHPDE